MIRRSIFVSDVLLSTVRNKKAEITDIEIKKRWVFVEKDGKQYLSRLDDENPEKRALIKTASKLKDFDEYIKQIYPKGYAEQYAKDTYGKELKQEKSKEVTPTEVKEVKSSLKKKAESENPLSVALEKYDVWERLEFDFVPENLRKIIEEKNYNLLGDKEKEELESFNYNSEDVFWFLKPEFYEYVMGFGNKYFPEWSERLYNTLDKSLYLPEFDGYEEYAENLISKEEPSLLKERIKEVKSSLKKAEIISIGGKKYEFDEYGNGVGFVGNKLLFLGEYGGDWGNRAEEGDTGVAIYNEKTDMTTVVFPDGTEKIFHPDSFFFEEEGVVKTLGNIPYRQSLKKAGRTYEQWLEYLKKKVQSGDLSETGYRQFEHIWNSSIEEGKGEEYAARAAIDTLPKSVLEEPTEYHGPEKREEPLATEAAIKLSANLKRDAVNLNEFSVQELTELADYAYESIFGEGSEKSEFVDTFVKSCKKQSTGEVLTSSIIARVKEASILVTNIYSFIEDKMIPIFGKTITLNVLKRAVKENKISDLNIEYLERIVEEDKSKENKEEFVEGYNAGIDSKEIEKKSSSYLRGYFSGKDDSLLKEKETKEEK